MKKTFIVITIISIFMAINPVKMHPAPQETRLNNAFNITVSYQILGVPLIGQRHETWCWAAGGAMILSYLEGRDISQCQVVENTLNVDCCRNDESIRLREDECFEGGFPKFNPYPLEETNREQALSWEQLTTQISKNIPVGFSWEWGRNTSTQAGHYMVATGYINFGSEKLVTVNDPFPTVRREGESGGSFKILTYDEYVDAAPEYYHWLDQYPIKDSNILPLTISNQVWFCPVSPFIPGQLEQDRKALHSLGILKNLPWKVTEKLGFDSQEDVVQSTLLSFYFLFDLSFEKLLNYQPGQSPRELINPDVKKICYSVYSSRSNELITSIFLRKRKDKWTLARYGGPEAGWLRQSIGTIPNGVTVLMLCIPELKYNFFVYVNNNEWYCMPVHYHHGMPSLSLFKEYPAIQFLGILHQLAKKIN